MNRYRSYMDRIRLDEEEQKRILEKAAAAAGNEAAEEKKVVRFRRKWVKIGTGIAAAAACAVILITVLPAVRNQEAAMPDAKAQDYENDSSGTNWMGGKTDPKEAPLPAQAEQGGNTGAAESVQEAAPPVELGTLFLKASDETVAVVDSIGDKVILSLLNPGTVNDGGDSATVDRPATVDPLATKAAASTAAMTEESDREFLPAASFVYKGLKYDYDPATGILTEEGGEAVQLEEPLRNALNEWLEEQK